MLRELTKADWLSILGIPEERIPRVLLLRGTRNLTSQYERYLPYFRNVLEIGCPNGIVEDVLIGDYAGHSVAYASVYGAAMASEVVHLFGVLGTRLVIQTGCCGALADELETGDLILPEEAFCGEGAAQYYKSDGRVVTAAYPPSALSAFANCGDDSIHRGRIFTTAALLAEGTREIEDWHRQGWAAVDMETATTFAVAEHFGMQRLAVLFAFDNPRKRRHILLGHEAEVARRLRGNERMIQLAFNLIRDYLASYPA
jgi:uridine phosphorylase